MRNWVFFRFEWALVCLLFQHKLLLDLGSTSNSVRWTKKPERNGWLHFYSFIICVVVSIFFVVLFVRCRNGLKHKLTLSNIIYLERNNLRSSENMFWFTFLGRQDGSNDGACGTERGETRERRGNIIISGELQFFSWFRNNELITQNIFHVHYYIFRRSTTTRLQAAHRAVDRITETSNKIIHLVISFRGDFFVWFVWF